MAAHGICFDFYYQPKPRQTGQNGCRVFVDTHFPALDYLNKENDSMEVFTKKQA